MESRPCVLEECPWQEEGKQWRGCRGLVRFRAESLHGIEIRWPRRWPGPDRLRRCAGCVRGLPDRSDQTHAEVCRAGRLRRRLIRATRRSKGSGFSSCRPLRSLVIASAFLTTKSLKQAANFDSPLSRRKTKHTSRQLRFRLVNPCRVDGNY